jgi:hypothetical protein
MFEIVLRKDGVEATIVPDPNYSYDVVTIDSLLATLPAVLGVENFIILVGPAQRRVAAHAEDYRADREAHRDTGQADLLEAALQKIGRPATPREIEAEAARIGFTTKAKTPIDVIRQVLRKYPRFKQPNQKTWTLSNGFGDSSENAPLVTRPLMDHISQALIEPEAE